MMVRKYGRRNRGMTRNYSDSGFDGVVSDSLSQESPQDVFNFTYSSQDSIHWSSDPCMMSNPSSQDINELAILPSRNGTGENGRFDGFDGVLWKSPKKVKIGEEEPFTLNLSQEEEEEDELTILPSKKSRETANFGYSGGVFGKGSASDPYCLESEDLAILPFKRSKENEKIDGVFRKTKKVKENGVLHKNKKNKKMKKKVKSVEVDLESFPVGPTTTLMETQEFGEMMEHVDEVNFALDGLKKGQPVRVRRASLLSLLSICGTVQQRRLLRAHGMAKTIIDAVLGLSLDDSPSNLAAATLFYILTCDGQDDGFLDSPNCIRFLMRLLKPLTSDAATAKASGVGSKLLAIRMDADVSHDSTKGSDSSRAAIMLKVQEVLVICKDLKPREGNNNPIDRPELNPKWISLLTMEKACLSTVSIEETSGTVRRNGGKFKEKLREFGGLNAVFDVARNCHSIMEGWLEPAPSSVLDLKDSAVLETLVLLLRCMKIMENATFLSKDNQSHLLGMKGNFDGKHAPRSFTKLILSVIKILSDISLLQSSLGQSQNEKTCNHSSEVSHGSDGKGDNEILCITSSSRCCSMEGNSSHKSFSTCQDNQLLTSCQLASSKSNSDTTTTSIIDPWLKMRIDSSTSETCSGSSGNPNDKTTLSYKRSGTNTNCQVSNGAKLEHLEESNDPFAFHEDDFEPSKWDLLSGRQTVFQTQATTKTEVADCENGCQSLSLLGQEESVKENHLSSGVCSSAVGEEKSNLLADCLLSAVKALMNLTNDNPVGCQQIADSGGLEILSSLIASHFPRFISYLPGFASQRENSMSSRSSVEVDHQNDGHLTDQELDLLVAILGLLVNLVEKDGRNRSRLAAASVSLPNLEGSEEESQTDLIPLLCSIFLANQGAGEAAGEGNYLPLDEEEALTQGEKEAEKMIIEAYTALLLAFLSTESRRIRNAIAECLPDRNLAILVPVLERFVEFHLALNMISPETHTTVVEVIESCRIP